MNRVDETCEEFPLILAVQCSDVGKNYYEMSRIDYIRQIVSTLERNGWATPSVAEERSYQEALFQLTRVLSDEADMPYNDALVDADFDPMKNACCNAHCRKQILQKVLSALQFMERKRFYDRPEDDEIRYYLIIKNFIRSIIIFFNVYCYDPSRGDQLNFPSPFTLMRRMEDAAELNSHVAYLLSFILYMDIRNDSEIKPFMGTKDKEPAVSYKSNTGNEKMVEVHNRFYYLHKFLLALVDLRSSELATCNPLAEERMAYVRAWKLASVERSGVEGKVNICQEELYRLFLERMKLEKTDIQRNCASIASVILYKLSINEHWEDLAKQSYRIRNMQVDQKQYLVKFQRELAKKCKPFASIKDLEEYISSIDQYVYIVNNLYLFLVYLNGDCRASYNLYGSEDNKFSWEALHALTLLRHGTRNWNVLDELIMLENLGKQDADVLESPHEFKKETKSFVKGNGDANNENVKMLRAIIAALRFVGDSNTRPDDEEMQLMQKIWQKASSSAHFFVAVEAFHQRRYTVEHRMLPNATSGESKKTTSELRGLNFKLRDQTFPNTTFYISNFMYALHAFKDGLIEKLEDLKRPTHDSS